MDRLSITTFVAFVILCAAPAGAEDREAYFGDLHVHTTYSSDAYFFSLPIIQGEGVHPPADACDFARFCSELDFFSINDHAELIGPRQWRETRESISLAAGLSPHTRVPCVRARL